MTAKSRALLEQDIYKLKGIAGILQVLATRDDAGEPIEMQDSFALLEDEIRTIYIDLLSILNGTPE